MYCSITNQRFSDALTLIIFTSECISCTSSRLQKKKKNQKKLDISINYIITILYNKVMHLLNILKYLKLISGIKSKLLIVERVNI